MKTMNNAYVVVNEKFNFIEGNREVVDEKHVRGIMNAMTKGEFIPPIIVDQSTRYIIDGQHRYIAASNLWKQNVNYELPVVFHKFENPLLAAILYNNKSKSWHIQNYINAYVKDNRESYIKLVNFCTTHKEMSCGKVPNYSGAIMIITHSYNSDPIKSGNLVITDDQCSKAEILYKELVVLRKYIPFMLDYKIIKAWIAVRDVILSNMTFDSYIKLIEKNFVAPASKRVSEWEHALLKITVNENI